MKKTNNLSRLSSITLETKQLILRFENCPKRYLSNLHQASITVVGIVWKATGFIVLDESAHLFLVFHV